MPEMFIDRERDQLRGEVERLRAALQPAAIILEALHAVVRWELAPEVKEEIAAALPKIRAALGVAGVPGRGV